MPTLDELLRRTLPLNRKERYYTGTVLPAIVGADGFAHLARLSTLLPTGPLDVRADPGDCTVVFFPYRCARSEVRNPNWFPVARFVAFLGERGELPPARRLSRSISSGGSPNHPAPRAVIGGRSSTGGGRSRIERTQPWAARPLASPAS